MSQAQKRVWKRDDEVQNHCNIWDIQHGHQQDVQTNYGGSSAHVQWFSCTEILEQTIVTSLYDVTRVSHARVGRNYKRRA